MTIDNAFAQIVTMVTELTHIIEREISTLEMLGNIDDKNIFINAKDILKASFKGNSFAERVLMLNAINTCAMMFEERICNDPLVSRYWLQHAYEFRVKSEIVATKLLHASGDVQVPKFECSLARLRISCAYLAKLLGYRDSSLVYAQGALRLAAQESDIKLTKSIMHTH